MTFLASTFLHCKPIDIGKAMEQAQAYATMSAANDAARQAIEDQRKAMEANREIARGFFSDWINGVRQGEGVFRSFERSIVGALNRIIDKLIQTAIEQMVLNTLFAAIGGGGGGGGGFFGFLTSALGSVLGGSLTGEVPRGMKTGIGHRYAMGGAFDQAQRFAMGGAFDQAQRFANGGAFTNSIVTAPTLFRFANGAKLGELGENGPEAIMPLKRGPNGSLGVQMHGGGQARTGDVHVTNHYNLTGGPDERTVATIVQMAERTKDQIRDNLMQYLREIDTDGTPSRG